MPRPTAQALSASLQWGQDNLPANLGDQRSYRFDVILSAADTNEATPDMQLTLDQSDRPTPVITPHPIVTGATSRNPATMRNPLALLEVDKTDGLAATYSNYTDHGADNVIDPGNFATACQPYTDIDKRLAALSDAFLSNQPDIKANLKKIDPKTGEKVALCSSANSFQCVALNMMREQLDADIAFLQENDFYDGCNYGGLPTASPAELVGRVLWNSGYLTRVSVSGATLRTVLQNSDKIKQQEQSSTNEPILRRQYLVTLGVTKSDGLYFVDGAAVDDNKIYSVATSDQLAFETSAYPQFGQVDLVAPSVFTGWKKQTYSIAQLAGLPFDTESPAIGDGSNTQFPLHLPHYPVAPGAVQIAVDGTVVGKDDKGDGTIKSTGHGLEAGTIDYKNGKIHLTFADPPPKAGALISAEYVRPPADACALGREEVVAAGFAEKDPIKALKASKPVPLEGASATELAVQNRNFLTITLQQASIGYTNSKPSQTDANINSNLAGVTNPNVASPHSDNLSYSDAFRLLYQWTAHWNLGFDQLIAFARSRQGSLTGSAQTTPTGQAIPSESISLSANSLIVSPFVEYQPHRYQGGHWKLVARPVTFSTQLSRTLQFLPAGMSKTTEFELDLKRQENWQPSVGGRYEKDSLNFFEAGYLNQTARNVLAALTINGMTTYLTAGRTAAEVAAMSTPTSTSVATPTYATFHQQGAYWLGMYTRNLTGNWKAFKVTYQGITYGNFFAYGAQAVTSTALTRYAAELSNNLQVQLWGNISVGPSYNIFWFQAQSHSAGDNLTRRDWNLQLNYLFDWHQGLEWKYALAGKTSQ